MELRHILLAFLLLYQTVSWIFPKPASSPNSDSSSFSIEADLAVIQARLPEVFLSAGLDYRNTVENRSWATNQHLFPYTDEVVTVFCSKHEDKTIIEIDVRPSTWRLFELFDSSHKALRDSICLKLFEELYDSISSKIHSSLAFDLYVLALQQDRTRSSLLSAEKWLFRAESLGRNIERERSELQWEFSKMKFGNIFEKSLGPILHAIEKFLIIIGFAFVFIFAFKWFRLIDLVGKLGRGEFNNNTVLRSILAVITHCFRK